jgi:hypothetical protein
MDIMRTNADFFLRLVEFQENRLSGEIVLSFSAAVEI